MIRMLIVGYCYGIRSERKLCEEVRLHLPYRWFCRLDLDDAIPHHSTFSENRLNRFREGDILRHIFERVVVAAMVMGLVKGEGLQLRRASWKRMPAAITAGRRTNSIGPRSSGRSARWLSICRHSTPKRRLKAMLQMTMIAAGPKVGDSAVTAKANKRAQFGYGLNYLIDVENAVIVDVEATPARTYDEVAATQTMLERTEERFDLKPKRLAADMAYGTGKFLGWLVKIKKIIPHIPVWDKSDRQDGVLSRSDFRWDKKRGVYVCPNGKLLRTSGTVHDGRMLLYRASKRDCDVCPIRAKCCTTAEARKIPRDLHEDARDVARKKMKTKAFAKSRDERKRPEMRFAHLKTHHASSGCGSGDFLGHATNSI
jgi:IS5 family transposase